MNPVSHQNFQDLIQSGEPLDPVDQSQLEAHLATCAECRAFAAYHQALLKAVPQAYPSARLSAAQSRRLADKAKAKLSHTGAARKLFGGLGALAYLGAAVLLVTLLGYGLFRLLPEQESRATGAMVRKPEKPTESAVLSAPTRTIRATAPRETPGAHLVQPTEGFPQATATPAIPGANAKVWAELQAQSGGAVNGVVLIGNTAYVGLGPRIAALDISQPTSPRLIAQTAPLPGEVTRLMKLPGGANTRLAAAAGNMLVVLDVTDQGEFEIGRQVTLPGRVNTMLFDINTNILYAGGQLNGRDQGFIVSHNMDTSQLPWEQQVSFPRVVNSLALGKGTLFAGLSATNQLSAAVIATTGNHPEKLENFATILTGQDVYSMSATGDRLYVGSYMSMLAYDITDPLSPKQVWKVTEAGKNQSLSMVYGFELRTDYIYTAGLMPAGGYVFSRVVFAPPEPVTSSSTVETASIVAVANGQMLVTGDGLEVYAIGGDGTLKQSGYFRPEQSLTFAVAVHGDYVYALQQASMRGNAEPDTLRTLRLPDLQEVSAIKLDHSQDQATQWGWFRGISVYQDRLYLFDGYERNWIFDLSRPEEPTLLSRPQVLPHDLLTGTVGASGKRLLMFQAFLASRDTQESTVMVYDASDPQNVQALDAALTVPERINRLVWNGTYLLALTEGPTQDIHTLHVISFNNDRLALVGQVPLPGYGMSLAFWKDQSILTAGDQLVTISLANPAKPAIVSQIKLPAANASMLLEGQIAWVWAADGGDAQLLAYDLSQQPPSEPAFQAEAPKHDAWLLAPDILGWSEPYLVMAGYSSGIEVWNIRVK